MPHTFGTRPTDSFYLYLDGDTPKYFLNTVLKYFGLSNPAFTAVSITVCPARSSAAARSSRMIRMKSCGDFPVYVFSLI